MIAAELQRPAFMPNETSQRVIAGLGGNGADAYGAELALLPVESSVYEQQARTVAGAVDPRQRVRQTTGGLPPGNRRQSRQITPAPRFLTRRRKGKKAHLAPSLSAPLRLRANQFLFSRSDAERSEERRVGKEGVSTCRSRGSP